METMPGIASGTLVVVDGNDVMSNTTELSEAKRALLEKYLRAVTRRSHGA